jgi:WhiB family redox-sensing transcriptional regulator
MSLTLTHPPAHTSPCPSSLLDDRTLEFATALAPAPAGVPGAALEAVADPATITESDEERGTSYARCSDGNGTLAHLFFSDDDHELARAKAICRPCGLKDTCLSGALERHEPYGVWGGMLVLEGVAVEVKRKRGRPPKHPKPVLVVDEVPIPDHLVA